MTPENQILFNGLRKLAASDVKEKKPSLLGSAARGAVKTTALAVPVLTALAAANRGLVNHRLKRPLMNVLTDPDSRKFLARTATATAMAAPVVGAAHGTLKHLSGTD
jgi:hypothetical protein